MHFVGIVFVKSSLAYSTNLINSHRRVILETAKKKLAPPFALAKDSYPYF